MPTITFTDLPEYTTNDKFTSPKKKKQLEKETKGEGIFNTLIQNKDLIANIIKGTSSIANTAVAVSQAVKSKNELDQIREISALREKAISEEKKRNKALSEDIKRRISKM